MESLFTEVEYAKRALGVMDLTSLNDTDTDDKIADLCKTAQVEEHKVAAVCIYPRFI